jgi:hypothetical protein
MTTPIDIVIQGTDQASGVINGVGDALGGLGGIAGSVLTAGLATAAAGVTALGAGLGYSLKQAIDAQGAQSRLAQVIKSTGGAAGLTQDAANQLADQFRDLAGGTSEAVIGIEEIGLRAGTISAQQMPNFIKTTLDLGQVMGDTTAAATLLARAQEDPVAAMNKAQRAGIVFSDALKEQIKQMVKSGDTAGATKLLMDRLGEATSGAAAANAETFAGKWELLQGHLSEAAQTIGSALLPIAEELFDNVIAPAIPIIEDLASNFGFLITKVIEGGATFDSLWDALGDSYAIGEITNALGITSDQFYSVEGAVDSFMAALTPLQNAFEGLWAAIQLQGPAAQAQFQAFMDWIMTNVGPVATQIRDNLANAITAVAQIWAAHGDEIMAATRIVFEVVAATIGGAFELISGIVTAGLQLLSGNWQGALTTMQDTLIGFFNLAASIVGTNWATFSKQWSDNWAMLQVIVSTVTMNMTSGIQTWLINTINTVKAKFAEFYQLGQDLMDNVYKGILLKVSQIINTVRDTVTNAIAAAGNALGGGGPQGNGAGYPGIAGKKAGGGAVTAGNTYLVGERGPELFTPGSGGSITPNNALGGNITLNVQLVTDSGALLGEIQTQARANGLTLMPVS